MKNMNWRIMAVWVLLGMLSVIGGTLHAEPLSETVVYEQGMNGYDTFRIPALIQASDGTLLAFAEGRKHSHSDTGDIDTVLRRSRDGGETWGPMQVVWDDGANTCGNPTVLLDESNGRIWLFSTHNLGQDSQREIAARTSDGVRTIWSCYSDDNGQSWSAPVNRFAQLQAADTRWDATGPGNGIQLRSGRHAGRLIVPAIGRNIQSDDHGATWHESSRLPYGGSEATVVELSDGTLMRNDRPTGPNRELHGRVVCYSRDQGNHWTKAEVRQDLVDPVCQGTAISHVASETGERMLAFANPAHTTRINMTVRLSYSDGQTYEYEKRINSDSAAYSCLASLADGQIGLLYENGDGWPYHRITFARFMPDWVKQSEIACWDFETLTPDSLAPTTPGAIKDSKGYGLDTTAAQGLRVVAGSGRFDGDVAVRFAGSGQGMRLSDSAGRGLVDFGAKDSFALSVVFRTTHHGSGGSVQAGALVAKDVAPHQPSWWLRVQDGRCYLFMEDGKNRTALISDREVSDGRWHELFLVRDIDQGVAYMVLDGQCVGVRSDSTKELGNDNDLMVGCFNSGRRSFQGDVDRVTIYRRPTAKMIAAYERTFDLSHVADIRDLLLLIPNPRK